MHTRESAFSWCLKKSSMVHDDRSLLDAVSLSVNDRVDSHLKHHSIRCKSKVHGTPLKHPLLYYCEKYSITTHGSQKKCKNVERSTQVIM